MLIKKISINELAKLLHNTNYGDWRNNSEACYKLAKHLDEVATLQGKPMEVDEIKLVQEWDIYKSLKHWMDEHGVTSDNLEDLPGTTFIPLDNSLGGLAGGLIAKNIKKEPLRTGDQYLLQGNPNTGKSLKDLFMNSFKR
jgi:hypothetical protein